MRRRSRITRHAGRLAAVSVAVGLSIFMSPSAFAANVKGVSTDPYTNPDSYHQTEVEADTFSSGSTIVSTFQMGRHSDGGASNVGFATSDNGGGRWTSAGLPNLTVYSTPPGIYQRATDPSVTFDAKHNVWMIVTLDSESLSGFNGDAVTVSRSTDGGLTWGAPVTIATASFFQSYDSTWGNCDNTPTSPFYGNCYVEFDDFGSGAIFHMTRSTDGGLTWADSSVPTGGGVIGGHPVTMPNGTVVVPIDSNPITTLESFVSADGGLTYQGPFTISSLSQTHAPDGGLRSLDIVSADVDAAGRVYVVWYDCRFRSGCAANDIVFSTSQNGKTWTGATRIPIDPTSSTADHFLPGLAIEPGTSGTTAHLALVYYFYPQTGCTTSGCQLQYGFIESSDGGATWSSAKKLAGPFSLLSLPSTTSGFMVGDYSSVSFVGSGAWTVFAVAKPGTTCDLSSVTACNEPMAVNKQALVGTGPYRPAGPTSPAAIGRRASGSGVLVSSH